MCKKQCDVCQNRKSVEKKVLAFSGTGMMSGGSYRAGGSTFVGESGFDDNSLYDWKPEEARTEEVRQMGFDKFPIVAETLDVEIQVRTFPAYSDTAPYDCPKTTQILEEAWKVLEQRFVADPKVPRSGRGGIIEVTARTTHGTPLNMGRHRRAIAFNHRIALGAIEHPVL